MSQVFKKEGWSNDTMEYGISNNFYSQKISIYSCQYKHELYEFQYLLDYPLLIPDNKYELDILELLE